MTKDPILLQKPKLVEKYVTDIEEFIPLLDTSVTDFITNVYAHYAGTHAEDAITLFHVIATILLDVFGTPQNVVDVVCKDERFMHWDTLDDFNKLCTQSNIFPGPILLYGSLRNRKDPIYNSDGQEFSVQGVDLDIDYTMLTSSDKPMLFNGGGIYLKDIHEKQKEFYCPICDTDKITGGGKYHFGYPIRYIGNDIYDVRKVTGMSPTGATEYIKLGDLLAMNKPNGQPACNINELLAPTLLPRDIVEKYGLKIKE